MGGIGINLLQPICIYPNLIIACRARMSECRKYCDENEYLCKSIDSQFRTVFLTPPIIDMSDNDDI